MAIHTVDYQIYKTSIFNDATYTRCNRCDTMIVPVEDNYPVADSIPSFQVTLPTIGDNLFGNPAVSSYNYWLLDNFEYSGGELCLNNTSPTYTPSVRQTVSDGDGWSSQYFKIRFSYTNQGFPDNPISIKMEIKNSLNAIVDTQYVSVVTSITKKEVTLYWRAPVSAETDYTFWFYLYYDNTVPIVNTTGFCFDDFSLYQLDEIADIVQLFSDDSVNVSYTTNTVGDKQLVNVTGLDLTTNNCFQLVITNVDEEATYTNWMRTKRECENLMLITWTDDCRFSDIDYANLPFTQSLYVKGYVSESGMINKERVQRTNGDGSIDTVFDHSLEKVEVKIGNYTKFTHRLLDRAFRHKTVTIDGEYYTLDEGSQYTLNNVGNGTYTARIELIRVDSQIVKSLCCC